MIKFIITTLLIIFFLRLVAPVLFRWLLGMFVRKKMRNGTFFYTNMHQQQRQRQEQQPNGSSNNGKTGKTGNGVKIDYIPEQPERKEFRGGQYVDYEEVK